MKDSIPPSPIGTGSERAGLFQAPDKTAHSGTPEDAQTEEYNTEEALGELGGQS